MLYQGVTALDAVGPYEVLSRVPGATVHFVAKSVEPIVTDTGMLTLLPELTLEQLFFNRPLPGQARFRTPIRDLWLCGSSTHPGGGIMGANGRIAALEVLRSRGRKVA